MVGVAKTLIYVVEDDPALRRLYRHELTASGFTVVPLEDGIDVLRLLDSGHHPDVIVLDLALPRLSGRDLHREVASNPTMRHIPIVVVTGTDPSDLDPKDFACVLRKPIRVERLVEAVRDCLRRASAPRHTD